MKYFFVLIILFISTDAFSQGCSLELLLQTPGTFKADAAHKSGKLLTVDLTKHKKVLATISSMIMSGYSPRAVKALFHENYKYPAVNRPVNDYGYSILPLNFYCDGNNIKVAAFTDVPKNNENKKAFKEKEFNNEPEKLNCYIKNRFLL